MKRNTIAKLDKDTKKMSITNNINNKVNTTAKGKKGSLDFTAEMHSKITDKLENKQKTIVKNSNINKNNNINNLTTNSNQNQAKAITVIKNNKKDKLNKVKQNIKNNNEAKKDLNKSQITNTSKTNNSKATSASSKLLSLDTTSLKNHYQKKLLTANLDLHLPLVPILIHGFESVGGIS